MTQTLPAPKVTRCYFDANFQPHLPAMCLHWDVEEDEANDWVWELPEGVRLNGPPPRQFGIRLQRQAEDSYSVRLLWDRTRMTWLGLTRGQLLASDLDVFLAALGTDLWYLLEQPVPFGDPIPPRAA